MRKILTTIILLIIMLTCTVNIVYATHGGAGASFATSTINPDDYKPSELTNTDAGTSIDLAKKIIGGITTVGIVVSVIMVLVLGIKYMMGSIEQKAEYKKTMFPMFIGALLLFSGGLIVSVIYTIVTNVG